MESVARMVALIAGIAIVGLTAWSVFTALVVPRVLAATLVAILLDAVVSVAGIAGGLWFGINSIHITSSDFFANRPCRRMTSRDLSLG